MTAGDGPSKLERGQPATGNRQEANWENRTLFHGDNLEIMRGMNSDSVDLVATDPPFNKGRDFHATPDSLAAGAKFQDRWSWERDVHEEWADQITDDYPRLMEAIESARYAHSDGMGAFMCFMAVRLLEMHRILKPTGSIYLHCDQTASHYLKAVMDAVFGWKQFQNNISWCYRRMSDNRLKRFARCHDVVLFYRMSKEAGFNADPVRQPYSESSVARAGYKKTSVGRIGPASGICELNERGRFPEDWWEIPILRPNAKERTGYPTQKPLPLYERMILASSNEGDVVCDPFAGCATTLVAAERLKRRWVGVDIWENAKTVVLKRLESERLALPEAERGDLFTEQIHFTVEPPRRTDDGLPAAPFLKLQWSQAEPPGPRMTRSQIYETLLAQQGAKCQGCDRTFDDPRYLELDHNTPRSDGGLNHISNRILLCSPCNRLKSNTFTLSGLRRDNKKRGYMP